MKTAVVQVPVSLLLDPRLSPSAKLIWMVLRLNDDGPASPAILEERAGLSRKTVWKGLVELAAAGWHSAGPGAQDNPLVREDATRRASSGADTLISDPLEAGERGRSPAVSAKGARVSIPGGLLDDRRVGVRGRILYGQVQLTPQFSHPKGRFTHVGLSELTCASPNTVKRAVRNLVATGWLHITQKNRLAPVHFSLHDPIADRGRAELDRARQRLKAARFRGEALMHAYLSLLVDSHDYEENASPVFLVNPWTDERMELDRFYPPNVAFEFNGPQHYGATDLFSEESAVRQRSRDHMKMGICADRGIRVVVIHAEDLSLEGMRRRIGDLLPLRDLNRHEHLIAYLEAVSRRYRLAARRGRSPA